MSRKRTAEARPTTTCRTIGRLASELGITVETVRYYERSGLLEQPPKRAHGWRIYDDATLLTLQYVREARRLGLAVSDIRKLHEKSRGPKEQFCQTVRVTVAERVQRIDARIVELMQARELLSEWLRECASRSVNNRCPTHDALQAARVKVASSAQS